MSRFFRPTSDDNISESVYPIYLKIDVQRVPTGQVNRINRYRDIDVGGWPKKPSEKTRHYFWGTLYLLPEITTSEILYSFNTVLKSSRKELSKSVSLHVQ